MKNPLTAGIEPATFRFVTQHLNHCATAVPWLFDKLNEKLKFICFANLYNKISISSVMLKKKSRNKARG